MYKIFIKRTCEAKVPFRLYVETNEDWTHFSHLHRTTVALHRLLWKSGRREIFLYKARRLYPLPMYDDYIVFRDSVPERHGYRNVYLDVRSGRTHFLDARIVARGEASMLVSEFLFSLPPCWRLFPRLFFWLFKRRMRKIMEEDNRWMRERLSAAAPSEPAACAPTVPESYDLFDDRIAEFDPARADIRFEYSVTEK